MARTVFPDRWYFLYVKDPLEPKVFGNGLDSKAHVKSSIDSNYPPIDKPYLFPIRGNKVIENNLPWFSESLAQEFLSQGVCVNNILSIEQPRMYNRYKDGEPIAPGKRIKRGKYRSRKISLFTLYSSCFRGFLDLSLELYPNTSLTFRRDKVHVIARAWSSKYEDTSFK